MDWFEGKEVGAYRLVRRLGVGGMAAVYLGEPLSGSGSAVAVKILHRRHVTDADIVGRFLDEARAANRIDHPGIVRVHYCDRSEEVGVFLVLELLEGQTLDERKRQRGALPPAQVVAVLQQVASAMQAAHRAGVIHRDLKASNIFLARDPTAPGGERVKVLDFGVAKLLRGGAGTRTGYVIGTFSHMPPEQMLDSKGVDARADVYALGAMGYFLLSGRHAYSDEQINRFLLGHRLPRPQLDEAPPELARVILRAMEHEREQRYPTMAAFAGALSELGLEADERGGSLSDRQRTSVVVAPAAMSREVPTAVAPAGEGETVRRASETLGLPPDQMAALARPEQVPALARPTEQLVAPHAQPLREAPEASTRRESRQTSRGARARRAWPLTLAAAGLLAVGLATFIALSGPAPDSRDQELASGRRGTIAGPSLEAGVTQVAARVEVLPPAQPKPRPIPPDAGAPADLERPALAAAPTSRPTSSQSRKRRLRRVRRKRRRARLPRPAVRPKSARKKAPSRTPTLKRPPTKHLDALDELKR